jgi:hypothetical protein
MKINSKKCKSINKNNGMYGKHHTEEAKEKMRQKALGRKLSKETRKKISKKLKGRFFSKEHRKKIGLKHKNKKISKKTRLKLSRSKIKHGKYSKYIKHCCMDCGKELHSSNSIRCKECYIKNKKINAKKIPIIYCIDCGKKLCQNAYYYNYKRCNSCAQKINTMGPGNPNWRGGISFEPYTPEFNDQLKKSIRKRGNYQCQNCGMTEEEHLIVIGTNLHVHHIDYNKKNNNENNLITLCNQCHLRTNYNRNYWKEVLKNKNQGVRTWEGQLGQYT